MTDLRKNAWYQLAVIALGAVAYLVMFAITRNVLASFAGLAVLALLGVPPMVFIRRRRWPLVDERDQAIWKRAELEGYRVFGLLMMFWGVWVGIAFADDGQVPYQLVAPVVWIGCLLMMAARSIFTLVLDSR